MLSCSQDCITDRENNLANHNNCKYYSFINYYLTFVLYTHEFLSKFVQEFHRNIVPPLFGCYWSYHWISMHVYMLLCVLQAMCLLNHVMYHRIPPMVCKLFITLGRIVSRAYKLLLPNKHITLPHVRNDKFSYHAKVT